MLLEAWDTFGRSGGCRTLELPGAWFGPLKDYGEREVLMQQEPPPDCTEDRRGEAACARENFQKVSHRTKGEEGGPERGTPLPSSACTALPRWTAAVFLSTPQPVPCITPITKCPAGDDDASRPPAETSACTHAPCHLAVLRDCPESCPLPERSGTPP